MAISTLKVETRLEKNYRVDVDCSNPFVIDQPKNAGGENMGPNPLEVYLSSLGACVCSIGKIISMQKRLRVKSIEVKIEGDIDKDFLMGKTTEGRSGFQELRAFVKVDANMSKEEKENFLKEIASRCPIADNAINTTKLVASIAE